MNTRHCRARLRWDDLAPLAAVTLMATILGLIVNPAAALVAPAGFALGAYVGWAAHSLSSRDH